MTWYQKTLRVLFILFVVVNGLYLHRVPGLMGDEASEGQNVYELLHRDGITLQGERSYIGPFIDYIRVPFIKTFGYTALAVRVPMFLASLATFLLAASVFKRWWGEERSLFPLVAMSFSLPYLTHQRLGWAITLLPFFFFLTIYLAQRRWNTKWVFVGFAAGLGLHTHIMFLPTLIAVMIMGPVATIYPRTVLDKLRALRGAPGSAIRKILMLLIGFWAAFGTQFVVLQLFHDDQGDPVAVGETFGTRAADLPKVFPVLLSGSSYVAHYTGAEFAPWAITAVTWLISILALLGVILSWRNKYVWLWPIGLGIHLAVLVYMIDRFSLRYFVMFILGVYVLAGLGAGAIVLSLARRFPRYRWFIPVKAIGLAAVLSILWLWLALLPFLRTGGSVASFSLGNRTDNASSVVDVRPLLQCLRGAGSVSSENVHIYNRLLYLSHQYPDLNVIRDEKANSAQYLVTYRLPDSKESTPSAELCPSLSHFIVTHQ